MSEGVTETVLVNVDVLDIASEDEKELQELYMQLGKAYYEGAYEDPLPQLLPLFSDITDILKKYEEKPKVCSGCGAELEEDARFCDVCGKPVETEDDICKEPKVPTCSFCGSPLREGARFCGSCGKPVE